MTEDSTVELLAYRPLGSQAELNSKRVSFKMTNQSAAKFGKSVALVSLIMLITSGVFPVLGARYVVKYDPTVNFSGAINVTNTGEDLIKAETADFRQDVHSRLVPVTTDNVSHVVSTQSDIASVNPKSQQNVSLSQVFKKHNYLIRVRQK